MISDSIVAVTVSLVAGKLNVSTLIISESLWNSSTLFLLCFPKFMLFPPCYTTSSKHAPRRNKYKCC